MEGYPSIAAGKLHDLTDGAILKVLMGSLVLRLIVIGCKQMLSYMIWPPKFRIPHGI